MIPEAPRPGRTRERLALLQAAVEDLLDLQGVNAEDILQAVGDGLRVKKHENVGREVIGLALACAKLRVLAERPAAGMVL